MTEAGVVVASAAEASDEEIGFDVADADDDFGAMFDDVEFSAGPR